MEIKEELENSIPINTAFFKTEITNDEIVKQIWSVLYPAKKYRSKSKQSEHIKIILVKLYDCYNSGYDFVRISRNSNEYKNNNDNNVLKLSYRVLIHVIDGLIDNEYVQQFMGYYDKYEQKGKISRIRATDKLIKLINEIPNAIEKLEDDKISCQYNNLIVFKDFNKKIIRYDDTCLVNEWREQLVAYNKLIIKSNILLNIDTYKKINYDDNVVKRIFNDMSFGLGGRFYGGWWQNLKSEYRKHLLIDGKETAEIDYGALHLILAYALLGIDYLTEIDDDPYQIQNIEPCAELRNIIKSAILVCINSKNKKEAVNSLNNKIRKKEIAKHPKYKMSEILEMCEQKHHLISDLFYSDVGKLLQYNDSMIANDIINHFTKNDKLVLCIHDSFVCQKENKEELTYRMRLYIENTYGTKINLKIVES